MARPTPGPRLLPWAFPPSWELTVDLPSSQHRGGAQPVTRRSPAMAKQTWQNKTRGLSEGKGQGNQAGRPWPTGVTRFPPPRLPLSQLPPAGASPCSLPRLRADTVGTCCCHRNHRCYHLPSLMPSPVPSAVEDPQGSTKGSPGHRLRPVVPPTDEHPSPEERGPGRTFSLLSLRVASGAARETHAFWSRCSFGHAF